MSSESIFSKLGQEYLQKTFIEALNKRMLEEAEPIIQETLKDIELKMRKNLAANLIQFMENNYDIEFDRQNINIRVRRQEVIK